MSQHGADSHPGTAEGAGASTGAPPAPAPPVPEPAPGPLTRHQRLERWLDVLTAVMLGVVTLATAWSGYQSTRWSGEQSALYAQASARRVEATRAATLGGQLRLYDLGLVNSWMEAQARGETELAQLFERRFRPAFRPVFAAWLALDPFADPAAPPGPLFMPQYATGLEDEADRLEAEAGRTFEAGQAANELGDAYVLNTVILATVLFLTAIAERFEWHPLRATVLVFALVMLLWGLRNLAVYPIT